MEVLVCDLENGSKKDVRGGFALLSQCVVCVRALGHFRCSHAVESSQSSVCEKTPLILPRAASQREPIFCII